MTPVQTTTRKVEVTKMRSKEINTGITLTKLEAETISKKLVAAGIDRKLVDRVIRDRLASDGCPKATNCQHCLKLCNGDEDPCKKYFRTVGPSDIMELKKQILERNIDIKKIDPKIDKLLRD